VSRRDVPAILTFGYLTALLSGLLSAVGAALVIVGARAPVSPTARDILGPDMPPRLDEELTSAGLDEMTTTRVIHGVAGLVVALLVVGVALTVHNGARWSRATLTVVLLGSMCTNALAIWGAAPASTKALAIAATALGVAAVSLLHLPGRNRETRRPPGPP
jgi:hypothetical protein